MQHHQIHFGRKFVQNKKIGYWVGTTDLTYAHRWVWSNHHGEIPKGFHIHHKDGNRSNNCIENLELISAGDHVRLHFQNPKRKETGRNSIKKIAVLRDAWNKSEEGKKRRSELSIIFMQKLEPVPYKCATCGKEGMTKALRVKKHCSIKCKMAKRYRDGYYDKYKTSAKCKICEKEYMTSRHRPARCCSKSCGLVYSHKNRRLHQ